MAQENGKHKFAIENLKNSVLVRLRESNPNISINSEHASIIDHSLRHLFKSFHTPTHPPYSEMIKRALKELKEENGSSEEAISEFIKKNYEDLPFAHAKVLNVHLKKLCLSTNLMFTNTGKYVLISCPSSSQQNEAQDS